MAASILDELTRKSQSAKRDQFNVKLRVDLRDRLRAILAARDIDQSQYIEALIEADLAAHEVAGSSKPRRDPPRRR